MTGLLQIELSQLAVELGAAEPVPANVSHSDHENRIEEGVWEWYQERVQTGELTTEEAEGSFYRWHNVRLGQVPIHSELGEV